jgi:hypothetical protein
MAQLLVGITGVKRSGKGSVAKFIGEWCAREQLSFAQRGLADEVKWAVAKLFWPSISRDLAVQEMDRLKNTSHLVEAYTGHSVDDSFSEWRELLERMGTEVGRSWGEDFWLDLLLPTGVAPGAFHWPAWRESFYVGPEQHADVAVVHDVRFPNEAQRVHALGGKVWHLMRPDHEPYGHASNQDLAAPFADTHIANDGDLNTLRTRVFDLMEATYVKDIAP